MRRAGMMIQTVVVLLGLLGLPSHHAVGLVLTKCDLKASLELSSNVTGPMSEQQLAQIVCKVEWTSGFNTSLVTDSTPPVKKPDNMKPPPKDKGPGPSRHGRSLRPRDDSHEDNKDQRGTGKLFGIFQLSNRLACSSGTKPSPNFCHINCSSLIDDNIEDDIACMGSIRTVDLRNVTRMDEDARKILKTMKSLPLPTECANIIPTVYFSGC